MFHDIDIPDTIEFEGLTVHITPLKPLLPIDKSFECSNPDYVEYYRVTAYADLQEEIAKTYLLTYKGKVIGYISIAMAHLRKDATIETTAKGLGGDIPALRISHLATHKDYVRKGVATHLIDLALEIAIDVSEKLGCRYIMLNPENDENVRKFYRNYGFTYVKNYVDDKDIFILDITQKE